MKAPRVRADVVRVGDLILTCYHWRTWKPVERVERHPPAEHERCVMVDTTTCRTWYRPDDLIACRPHASTHCDHKFIDSVSCLKCGWTPVLPVASP